MSPCYFWKIAFATYEMKVYIGIFIRLFAWDDIISGYFMTYFLSLSQ